MTWTTAQRRASRREYQRLYASPKAVRSAPRPVDVPIDAIRLDTHEPCFLCGAARHCKHRPFMLVRG